MYAFFVNYATEKMPTIAKYLRQLYRDRLKSLESKTLEGNEFLRRYEHAGRLIRIKLRAVAKLSCFCKIQLTKTTDKGLDVYFYINHS